MNLEEKLYREDIKIAHLSHRFFALLVDEFLISLILTLIYWNEFSHIGSNYYQLSTFVASLVIPLTSLYFAYEVLFTFLYGATLGKMLFKIHIVTSTLLDKPSFLESLFRAIFKIAGRFILYISYCSVFFTPFRQTLHDYLARTLVVQNG